jgi:uncharacterized protein HemX
MSRQTVVAWLITTAIGLGAGITVVSQYVSFKTETPSPTAPPAKGKPETQAEENKQAQEKKRAEEKKQAEEKRAQEDRQAQRWVCSHTTRQTVTIMTGVSGAIQGYLDQCDEWKLKEP